MHCEQRLADAEFPETALVETQAGTNVFVVGKDNKVESRKVVAGSSYKQQRVINDGLKHGEQVIIQGVQSVFSPPTHSEAWPGGKRQSRLVVIGRRLRKDEILAAFEKSLERPATTFDPRWGAI